MTKCKTIFNLSGNILCRNMWTNNYLTHRCYQLKKNSSNVILWNKREKGNVKSCRFFCLFVWLFGCFFVFGFFFAWGMHIFLNVSKAEFDFCEHICNSKIQEQILFNNSYKSSTNINNQLKTLLIISKLYRSHFLIGICYQMFVVYHSVKKSNTWNTAWWWSFG